MPLAQVEGLATVVYHHENQAAPISSGSFKTDGMIVAPCSMKTLAAVRMGFGDRLSRGPPMLLERSRKLVLLARESPFSEIHLENMLALARMGVVIFPPIPALLQQARNGGRHCEPRGRPLVRSVRSQYAGSQTLDWLRSVKWRIAPTNRS